MQLCQILALCTKEVPSREAAPEKFVRGCEATAIPTPAGTWPVLGFYTIMVLPLDAMGRNATQCQGATKSPCLRQVPAMDACGSAVPCRGDRWLPPRWVTAPPPALCPLPSPGESPVASQPTCGHGSGSQGRPAAGGEPREGLCWVAPTRDAERRPGFMVRSSGEQSLPLRHSSHAAGERKPEPSWLPAACLAFPAAALATASDGG